MVSLLFEKQLLTLNDQIIFYNLPGKQFEETAQKADIL